MNLDLDQNIYFLENVASTHYFESRCGSKDSILIFQWISKTLYFLRRSHVSYNLYSCETFFLTLDIVINPFNLVSSFLTKNNVHFNMIHLNGLC